MEPLFAASTFLHDNKFNPPQIVWDGAFLMMSLKMLASCVLVSSPMRFIKSSGMPFFPRGVLRSICAMAVVSRNLHNLSLRHG